MEGPAPKLCPRCGEIRILAPECPRCGVLYARAEARAARVADSAPLPAPVAPPSAPTPARVWGGDVEEARHELRVRQLALPCVLLGAWLLVQSPLWGRLLRIFLSMWIHELGHALSAWLCGFPALPGPWVTLTWDEPSTPVTVLLAAALTALGFRGFFTGQRLFVAVGALGLVLQFVGTGLLSYASARQLITFGGDAGCLVLGTLLLMTLYLPRDSALRQGWLHWGYMGIGAAAFMDAFTQWWAARTDFERIPFGANEGVGLSDPSKLVDLYGWGERELVHRYTGLGLACLAVLGVLYAVGLWRARAALQALERQRGP